MSGFGCSKFGGGGGGTGGGSSISNPKVVYVRSDGNNATGVVGNPSKPFLTAQAAWTAIKAAVNDVFDVHCFDFGVGEFFFTLSQVEAGQNYQFFFRGAGVNEYSFAGGSSLTFSATGVTGETGPPGSTAPDTNGGEGGTGLLGYDTNVFIASNHSIELNVYVYGGQGGAGGVGGAGQGYEAEEPFSPKAGGTGGIGGPGGNVAIRVYNAVINIFEVLGGAGGAGGAGGLDADSAYQSATGDPGADGLVNGYTQFCSISSIPGGGFTPSSGANMVLGSFTS